MKSTDEDLDLIFHALADSTRRRILFLTAQQACNITDLAKPFDMSLAAVSKHIKVLEKANLLHKDKQGRIQQCRLNHKPLLAADKIIKKLHQYWENQLDSLESFLSNSKMK